MASFSVRSSVQPPTVRLRVKGDLDLFAARNVSRSIDRALGKGCKRVLVDAGGVTFVNGSALGVFMRTLAVLTADSASMEFTAVSPTFERLCTLTGIDQVLGLSSLAAPAQLAGGSVSSKTVPAPAGLS
ncbi:MAG: STAS domain-containing protein [Nocardioides sp.]